VAEKVAAQVVVSGLVDLPLMMERKMMKRKTINFAVASSKSSWERTELRTNEPKSGRKGQWYPLAFLIGPSKESVDGNGAAGRQLHSPDFFISLPSRWIE
jgi:hypothetical protein